MASPSACTHMNQVMLSVAMCLHIHVQQNYSGQATKPNIGSLQMKNHNKQTRLEHEQSLIKMGFLPLGSESPCLPSHPKVILTISTNSCRGPVGSDPPYSHTIRTLHIHTNTHAHTHRQTQTQNLGCWQTQFSQKISLCLPSVILPQTQTLQL